MNVIGKIERGLQVIRLRYATLPFFAMITALHLIFVFFYIFNPALGVGEYQLTDYISFWTGGQQMSAGTPENIFNEPVFKALQESALGRPFKGILPWVISPSFMIYAVPLAKLSYIPSFFVYNFVTLGAYGAMIWALLPRKDVLLAMLALPSVLFCLYHGQTGLMSAALIGGMIVFLPKRPFLAGMLLGLLIYKPQLGLLFPIALIAGGYWRTIAGAALTAIASVVLSFYFFGWEIWDFYLFHNAQIFENLIETQHSFARIQTVFGLTRIITGSSFLAMIVQGGFSLVSAVVVFLSWRQKQLPYELKAAILVLGICFATPYLQLYDYPLLGFVFALLFRLGQREGYLEGDKEWMLLAGMILYLGAFLSIGIICSGIMAWRIWLHMKAYKEKTHISVSSL